MWQVQQQGAITQAIPGMWAKAVVLKWWSLNWWTHIFFIIMKS